MNEEFAREIEWKPRGSVGSPCPQVLSSGNRTFLIYYIDEPEKDWDETTNTLVLVEFERANSHRFGIVNDEAADGHPLYEKGLNVHAAHIVEDSTWIKELKQMHMVHPRFSESHWTNYKHYLLFFKDEIFEIIAHNHKIEIFKGTVTDLSVEVVKRLNS